jgi:uncharacterized protein
MAWTRALVTGASSGIGDVFARKLAAQGTELIVVARRRDRLDKLAADLPVDCEVLEADLATDDGVDRVIDRLGTGDVDLLVNNAGFGSSGALVDVDADSIADEIRVNCLALVRLSRAAIGPMVEKRHGGILNVASVAGFQPAPKMAAYAGTKAFVLTFTESEELHGTGVKVQALCPGLTRTEFQDVASYEATSAPGFMWQTADEVVDTSLAALDRGRVVVIPGVHNRLAMGAAGFLPRYARRKVASVVQSRQH